MMIEMDLPAISCGLSATTHTSTVGVPSAALKNCALRCSFSGETTEEEEVVCMLFKTLHRRLPPCSQYMRNNSHSHIFKIIEYQLNTDQNGKIMTSSGSITG